VGPQQKKRGIPLIFLGPPEKGLSIKDLGLLLIYNGPPNNSNGPPIKSDFWASHYISLLAPKPDSRK